MGRSAGGPGSPRKVEILAAGTGLILVADVVTKWMVQQRFHLGHPVEVVGDLFRFTYVLNPGAAFGIHVGTYSREVFTVLSAVAVAVLAGLFWSTPSSHRLRLHAIALVVGGALGNLLDRIRSPYGVVDFLDVGLGSFRWPVFNVADVGVTVGALLLALSLWEDEVRGQAERAVARGSGPGDPGRRAGSREDGGSPAQG